MAFDDTFPWRQAHLLMRLAREWDLRFENLFRTGAVRKWYSSVGNEAVSVGAALALEPGDALVTLHRDVGAILAHYLDPARLFPGLAPPPPAPDRRPDPSGY